MLEPSIGISFATMPAAAHVCAVRSMTCARTRESGQSRDEPGGTATANQAGLVTRAWWDSHGTGPTCAELIGAVFKVADWDDAIEDPDRTRLERHEQLDLLHRWLISYWSRLGTISFIPGHDEVVRPGRTGQESLSGMGGAP